MRSVFCLSGLFKAAGKGQMLQENRTKCIRFTYGSKNRNVAIMKLGLLLPILGLAFLAPSSHSAIWNKAEALPVSDLTPVKVHEIPKHQPVEIVKRGRPRAKVFVAETRGTQNLNLLVSKLVETIKLSTGAELQVADAMPPAGQPTIVIGDCADSRRAGINPELIPIEGFEVKTAPNRVYLVGSTKVLPPGSDRWAQWSNDGTAWAVADFLERFVGVRWYWPVEAGGQSIVKTRSLKTSPTHYSDQPVFRLRGYYPPDGWKLPAKARDSDKAPLPFATGAIPDGVTRVDMGTYLPLLRAGCSWPYKIKVHEPQNLQHLGTTFHAENKEMFALKKDGTRDLKMFCYSSPKALQYLLDGCERVWGKGGNASWVTSTCVTVSPGDYAVMCRCPECQATFARAGGHWVDGGSLVMATFVQRMCEAVKSRWPDKKVIYLPYWNYDTCRREVQYPDNLVVMSAMTTYPMPLKAQRENFEESIQRLRDFRAQACVPVTTWDYSVAWTYGPYQYPHVVRDYYQAVKGLSAGTYINGLYLGEWTNTAPTMYVWMKALWNPDLDVDAVLDEMCRRLYGKAGGTARELMKLECDVWEKGEWTKNRIKQPGGWPVPRRLFPVVFTPDVVGRMESLRNKALAELADDPVARQRFLYWTWTFDAFLKEAEAIHRKKTP
jgi:hypothetical protein